MTLPYRDPAPPAVLDRVSDAPSARRLCADLAVAALLCGVGALLVHWLGAFAQHDPLAWVRALP